MSLITVGMLGLCDAISIEIACEKIETVDWFYSVGEQKSCFLDNATLIDSSDYEVILSKQDLTRSVKGIWFAENRNISYLPISLFKSLPSLTGIEATSCSIKELHRKTFTNLFNLTLLWLRDNQIEKISEDTFVNLTSLKGIDLREITQVWI